MKKNIIVNRGGIHYMMIESYKATFNDEAEGHSKPKERTKSYPLELFYILLY